MRNTTKESTGRGSQKPQPTRGELQKRIIEALNTASYKQLYIACTTLEFKTETDSTTA